MKILASLCLSIALIGCATRGTYQSISAAETIVLNANSAYLEGVFNGTIPTNSVPQVEQAFNETQLTLHTAVVIAQGNKNAPVTPEAAVKVSMFTNLVNNAKGGR